ncbi:MAG: Xaa-Pro aminopeptidase [Candidatus Paceibacteria bacterium]|jgi:Xaa-Pro aminopeptidase
MQVPPTVARSLALASMVASAPFLLGFYNASPAPTQGVADSSLVLPGVQSVLDPNTPTACRSRREALAAAVGDGLFLFQAGPEADGRFQADPDFYWLTGFHRPDAKVLLVAKEGKLERDELFLPVQTERERLWEGPKLNPVDFPDDGPFGSVRPLEDFNWETLGVQAGETGVHAVDEWTIAELVEQDIKVKRGRTPLNLLQAVKSEGEIAALEMAVDITQAALADAMRIALPGTFEFQAEAAIESGFRRRGSEFLAFATICGSGPNGCFLHYRANQRQLQAGDLLLMDVGAKYAGYSADVTRTIPVSGKFSKRQREVYELVLEAQNRSVAALKPGVTMRAVHNASVAYFEEHGVREHFKHGVGHQLGIRVHDVPGFRGELTAGMLVTVEPGLYLAEEGIGIRIEDDYLITETGSRKLSDSIPSDPDALEAYIARLRGN